MTEQQDTSTETGDQVAAGAPVEHLADLHRFRIRGEGGREVALLNYVSYDGTWDFEHTWTDPALRGHGLAAKVVLAAFETARDADVRVVPSCPYTADWLRSHPEFESLTGQAR